MSHDQLHVASVQALAHALDGEHATARRWLARSPSLSELDAQPEAVAASLFASALLTVDCLDWPRFDELVAELGAMPLTAQEHLDLMLHVRARAALVRGDQHRLLAQFDQVRESRSVRTMSRHAALLAHAEGELALSVGDAPRATATLSQLDGSYLHALLSARLQLARGEARTVVRQLTRSKWLEEAPQRGRIEIRFALATALDRTGESAEAARTVRQALTQAGNPAQIAYSLATADRESLQNAAERDTAITTALTTLDTALFIPPFDRPPPSAASRLSRRERAVLELLATGMTAAEVAEKLYVSVHTVRNQTQRIYRKLNANSREQALKIAARYGHLKPR